MGGVYKVCGRGNGGIETTLRDQYGRRAQTVATGGGEVVSSGGVVAGAPGFSNTMTSGEWHTGTVAEGMNGGGLALTWQCGQSVISTNRAVGGVLEHI